MKNKGAILKRILEMDSVEILLLFLPLVPNALIRYLILKGLHEGEGRRDAG
jgi:hypothetical protein